MKTIRKLPCFPSEHRCICWHRISQSLCFGFRVKFARGFGWFTKSNEALSQTLRTFLVLWRMNAVSLFSLASSECMRSYVGLLSGAKHEHCEQNILHEGQHRSAGHRVSNCLFSLTIIKKASHFLYSNFRNSEMSHWSIPTYAFRVQNEPHQNDDLSLDSWASPLMKFIIRKSGLNCIDNYPKTLWASRGSLYLSPICLVYSRI